MIGCPPPMTTNDLQPLAHFLQERRLPHDQAVLARFDTYLSLLLKGRKKMNLIGPLSTQEIINTLFCDSLTIAALRFPLPIPIMDVGSGAGLPSLPLKFIQPDAPLMLVEPREKRHRFLGHVVRTLGLKDVSRHRVRIEAMPEETVGCLCSKAFAPLKVWLEVAAPRVRPGGVVAVLCADSHWNSERERQADQLGLELVGTSTSSWVLGSPLRRTLMLEKR